MRSGRLRDRNQTALASIDSSALAWETFTLVVSTSRFYTVEALLPRKGRSWGEALPSA